MMTIKTMIKKKKKKIIIMKTKQKKLMKYKILKMKKKMK